jgi:hypothetical protein
MLGIRLTMYGSFCRTSGAVQAWQAAQRRPSQHLPSGPNPREGVSSLGTSAFGPMTSMPEST